MPRLYTLAKQQEQKDKAVEDEKKRGSGNKKPAAKKPTVKKPVAKKVAKVVEKTAKKTVKKYVRKKESISSKSE